MLRFELRHQRSETLHGHRHRLSELIIAGHRMTLVVTSWRPCGERDVSVRGCPAAITGGRHRSSSLHVHLASRPWTKRGVIQVRPMTGLLTNCADAARAGANADV